MLDRFSAEVKSTKYLSVSVDSTADVSHVDQLTSILLYVHIRKMSITAEGIEESNSKLATASCRLTNQVEGICSGWHIISQFTLLSNDCLHTIIFPTHVASIVVRPGV